MVVVLHGYRVCSVSALCVVCTVLYCIRGCGTGRVLLVELWCRLCRVGTITCLVCNEQQECFAVLSLHNIVSNVSASLREKCTFCSSTLLPISYLKSGPVPLARATSMQQDDRLSRPPFRSRSPCAFSGSKLDPVTSMIQMARDLVRIRAHYMLGLWRC